MWKLFAHPACVEVERLPLFVAVQYFVQVSVCVKDAAPKERVCRFPCQSCKPAACLL